MCLIGLLLFALTGITLSHARQIEATPQVTHRNLGLPVGLRAAIDGDDERKTGLPAAVGAWLDDRLQAQVTGRVAEWSADEIYLSMPRPGGDGWLSIASLDQLVITAPDGQTAKPEHAVTGKYRSVFDLQLTQQGTYKLALVNQGLFANYELDGQKKRWRGTAGEWATAIPAAAKNVQVTVFSSRVETFVSNGKPNATALKPSGRGLELVPVTRITDLVAGEAATFQLLLDGRPAADVKVSAIAGATRYRNAQDEQATRAGKDGKFQLTWPHAGMYWINASTQDGKSGVKQARQRRLSYTATLEVLPE